MVLQSQYQDEPPYVGNQERQTLSTFIQVLELPRRPPGGLKPMSVLEAQIQQRVASKEIHQDLGQLSKVNLF